MTTIPATTKVPLFEAAQRAETLVDLINEGVNVEEELTAELVTGIQSDLAHAIDRRYFLKTNMEKQIEVLKDTRDLITKAIKNREAALESVQRTTTLALQQFTNIKAEGEFCKVSLRAKPVSVKHIIEVKQKSFSNVVNRDELLAKLPEVAPYLKMVTLWQLDSDFLKEALATEIYSWAHLEKGETCQFRSK